MSKSKFDYICRIDQDDIMRHDRLTKQLEFLQNNPNKMGVCSYALKINSQNKVVGHLKPKVSKKWDEFQLIFQNNLIHSAMMLRKENLLVLGGYTIEKSLQPPEDFELWSRYMQNYPDPFGLIPEFLTYYRISQNSMSRINPKIEPGSEVVLPEGEKRKDALTSILQYVTILAQIGTSVATLTLLSR